jgi:hypothetical protein
MSASGSIRRRSRRSICRRWRWACCPPATGRHARRQRHSARPFRTRVRSRDEQNRARQCHARLVRRPRRPIPMGPSASTSAKRRPSSAGARHDARPVSRILGRCSPRCQQPPTIVRPANSIGRDSISALGSTRASPQPMFTQRPRISASIAPTALITAVRAALKPRMAAERPGIPSLALRARSTNAAVSARGSRTPNTTARPLIGFPRSPAGQPTSCGR